MWGRPQPQLAHALEMVWYGKDMYGILKQLLIEDGQHVCIFRNWRPQMELYMSLYVDWYMLYGARMVTIGQTTLYSHCTYV